MGIDQKIGRRSDTRAPCTIRFNTPCIVCYYLFFFFTGVATNNCLFMYYGHTHHTYRAMNCSPATHSTNDCVALLSLNIERVDKMWHIIWCVFVLSTFMRNFHFVCRFSVVCWMALHDSRWNTHIVRFEQIWSVFEYIECVHSSIVHSAIKFGNVNDVY